MYRIIMAILAMNTILGAANPDGCIAAQSAMFSGARMPNHYLGGAEIISPHGFARLWVYTPEIHFGRYPQRRFDENSNMALGVLQACEHEHTQSVSLHESLMSAVETVNRRWQLSDYPKSAVHSYVAAFCYAASDDEVPENLFVRVMRRPHCGTLSPAFDSYASIVTYGAWVAGNNLHIDPVRTGLGVVTLLQ